MRNARLAALWFGLQLVWGAILAVLLQARTSALAPHDALRAFATIAAGGAAIGMLAQLAAGPLADRSFARRGHRQAYYAAGVAVAVGALIWFEAAPSFAQLCAAFLVLQAGMNVATGPYQAIVPDYVAAERVGRASAWMGVFQPLGNSAGLLIAAFVAAPRAVALLLTGGLAATWAVTAAAVRRAQPQPQPPDDATATPGRDVRTLIVSRAAINVGFYTLVGFMYFFVEQSLHVRGAAIRTQTALVFLTFTLCNAAGAALAARPADRYDKRFVVLAANGAVALGLVALALAPGIVVAFVAAAVAGLAWGAYFIADWALACTLLPRARMASAMAVWNIAAGIPQIVAPLVTAPLVSRVNAASPGAGPRVAIVLAIAEFTLGAAWLLRLPAQRPLR